MIVGHSSLSVVPMISWRRTHVPSMSLDSSKPNRVFSTGSHRSMPTRAIFSDSIICSRPERYGRVHYAQSADNNFKDTDMSVWDHQPPVAARIFSGTVYSNINTASGIIENASEVGLSEAMISEAASGEHMTFPAGTDLRRFSTWDR